MAVWRSNQDPKPTPLSGQTKFNWLRAEINTSSKITCVNWIIRNSWVHLTIPPVNSDCEPADQEPIVTASSRFIIPERFLPQHPKADKTPSTQESQKIYFRHYPFFMEIRSNLFRGNCPQLSSSRSALNSNGSMAYATRSEIQMRFHGDAIVAINGTILEATSASITIR